jgi:O-antigen/teichoic acid export membrane protein
VAAVRALNATSQGDRALRGGGSDGGTMHTARLARTAASLMSTTVLTSLLGVAFWAVAARLYSVQQVGLDSALISVLVMLSTVGQLNLSNTIVRFLPRARRIKRRIGQSYAVAAGVSLAAAIAFVLAAPHLIPRYHFLADDGLLAGVFVVGLAAWSIFSLQDSVLVALGRAPWLPIENGLFSAAKIVMLPVGLAAFGASGHGVLLAWLVPLFVSVAIISWLLVRRVLAGLDRPGADPNDGFGKSRGLAAFIGQDLIGTVLGQLTGAAIPLIVVASLGPAANAYFFLPYTLVTTLDLVFLGLATAVTAEASREENRLRELVGQAARYLAGLQIPALVVIVVFAPLVLKLFGPAYARHGVTLIRLLAAASCFRSVLFLFVNTARVRRRGVALLVVEVATALLLVGLMITVARHGSVNSIAAVWLGVHAAVACAVVPLLVRMLRVPSAAAGKASAR